jgi:hypothetical protein
MNCPRPALALSGASPLLLVTVVALLLAPSCASTSARTYSTPEEATAAITTAAATGDMQEAGLIFDSFAEEPVQRDRVYAALFDAASVRYESGRNAEAANLLTFVTERYPHAAAAREALVYALFLERAEVGAATDASTSKMKKAITAVRSGVATSPPGVDLAETQVAIDGGDLARARDTFDAFLTSWDQTPPELVVYVEDIDRYLQSH